MIDWMLERLIPDKGKGKKQMCATCKATLEEVNKSDNNCSIVLDKITFNIFSHYMSTKKSKKSGRYLSDTSYDGVQSPLTNMYCMSGKTMDVELNKELYQFILGMKRVVASNNI